MIFAKLRILGLAAIAGCAVACVVESDHTRGGGGGYMGGGGTVGGTPSSPGGGSGNGSGSATNGSPILVDVDTDKTMNAAPGQGVGVFIEYATGGHWHVWWTCDTSVNPQALTCDFAIKITVTQGAIALTGTEAPTSAVRTSGSPVQELDATTTTGAEVHAVHFDTDPGAVITVDAAISGQRDGRYFFFVQNGQVNGGFTGTLSDPLMLEGSRP